MPKLWNTTIAAHRQTVRDAILETTWALVREHGLMSVTMTQIAEKAGIGRATLYKYFPDVEAILAAHHERHVTGHLAHLTALRDQPGTAGERLQAVLEQYALICATTDNDTGRANWRHSCTGVSRSRTLSSSSPTCSGIC
ncbi:TetR/AcrR family transcriptional regulator [Micromonospora sp. BQ11]|uniref:TetR/AcrR family transcriptional regulator n=1 Tax=Micromonospora sp. BQ11 TaxID=3452212 RepID=UPI003F8A353E